MNKRHGGEWREVSRWRVVKIGNNGDGVITWSSIENRFTFPTAEKQVVVVW